MKVCGRTGYRTRDLWLLTQTPYRLRYATQFYCQSWLSIVQVGIYPLLLLFVCVYSNTRNDVPRVAQRYGTIAAHKRRRASVLVVFVVFCVHMYSFAGLIRRTPPPTFSDTAITDRHSDTTIFQLRAHWVRISWSIGSEKSFFFFTILLSVSFLSKLYSRSYRAGSCQVFRKRKKNKKKKHLSACEKTLMRLNRIKLILLENWIRQFPNISVWCQDEKL